jgi:hypothetical protein
VFYFGAGVRLQVLGIWGMTCILSRALGEIMSVGEVRSIIYKMYIRARE